MDKKSIGKKTVDRKMLVRSDIVGTVRACRQCFICVDGKIVFASVRCYCWWNNRYIVVC